MEQKNIKIPLSCRVLWYIAYVVAQTSFFIIALSLFELSWTPYELFFILLPSVFAFMFKTLSFVIDRSMDDEPILPFKFNCKCDED